MTLFRYDAHTHARLPDGQNLVEDIVRAAVACNLECVAITDHLLIETDHEQIKDWQNQTQYFEQSEGITVIQGLEGVILGPDGVSTIDASVAKNFEFIMVNIGPQTRGVVSEPPASLTRYLDNLFSALNGAVATPYIDAIVAPFCLGRYQCSPTPEQLPHSQLQYLAENMQLHNVAFEINQLAWWWHPETPVNDFTREYARVLKVFSKAGVKFIVGSAARSAGAVGNFQYCNRLMSDAGIELSQLVDLKRMALGRRH